MIRRSSYRAAESVTGSGNAFVTFARLSQAAHRFLVDAGFTFHKAELFYYRFERGHGGALARQDSPLAGTDTAPERQRPWLTGIRPGSEVAMIKATVAVLLTFFGSSAVGVAAYLQTHPRAFTKLERQTVSALQPAAKNIRVHADRAIVELIDPNRPVLTIGEIVIDGEPKGRPVVERAAAKRTAVANRPCSDWWELGPESRVRMLCP